VSIILLWPGASVRAPILNSNTSHKIPAKRAAEIEIVIVRPIFDVVLSRNDHNATDPTQKPPKKCIGISSHGIRQYQENSFARPLTTAISKIRIIRDIGKDLFLIV